jgi:hypothetical protein
MALVLEIIIGAIILGAFAVAFFSARTWPIYQVVLVVFVFLAAVGFFYMSARTLRTHQAWGKALNQAQKEIENQEKRLHELREGGAPGPEGQPEKGIRQLRHDLERLATDRGGVLRDVEVAGVKDGAVQLKMKSPDHGLVADSVVFAFDQVPYEQGGRFQGEFKVTAVTEGSPDVQAVPNLPLTEAQAQALAKAKGPWALYATMPVDDATVFAALDDAARAKLLPKDSVADYAKADRKLHDYKAFFHEDVVQRALIADSIAKISSNIQRIDAATKECNAEIAYRTTEQTDLTSDLGQFNVELKAITAYESSLESLYRQVRESLKATYVQMRDRAADLTARQFKAAEEINRRSATASAR